VLRIKLTKTDMGFIILFIAIALTAAILSTEIKVSKLIDNHYKKEGHD
jgi:hypothetical protein